MPVSSYLKQDGFPEGTWWQGLATGECMALLHSSDEALGGCPPPWNCPGWEVAVASVHSPKPGRGHHHLTPDLFFYILRQQDGQVRNLHLNRFPQIMALAASA